MSKHHWLGGPFTRRTPEAVDGAPGGPADAVVGPVRIDADDLAAAHYQQELVREATECIRAVISGQPGRLTERLADGTEVEVRNYSHAFHTARTLRGRMAALERDVYLYGLVMRGLDPATPPVMIFNAASGKPPERWLELSPREAKTLRRHLDRKARPSAKPAKRKRRELGIDLG